VAGLPSGERGSAGRQGVTVGRFAEDLRQVSSSREAELRGSDSGMQPFSLDFLNLTFP
jgi:hypothetical protein